MGETLSNWRSSAGAVKIAKTTAFYLWGESGDAGLDQFGAGKALGLPNRAPQVQCRVDQDDSQVLHSATTQGDKVQPM